jgi:hypothetical protein
MFSSTELKSKDVSGVVTQLHSIQEIEKLLDGMRKRIYKAVGEGEEVVIRAGKETEKMVEERIAVFDVEGVDEGKLLEKVLSCSLFAMLYAVVLTKEEVMKSVKGKVG